MFVRQAAVMKFRRLLSRALSLELLEHLQRRYGTRYHKLPIFVFAVKEHMYVMVVLGNIPENMTNPGSITALERSPLLIVVMYRVSIHDTVALSWRVLRSIM